ncbi:hypothetical protein [uncultured Clostridium sp.]|uniref:hypothetical protein n=1 Tax=uncultured Clostridium sp. TaxID=59620 RepID=UPI0027DBB88F|nr:hypothetical protein [uncultured Clostridium sp.]
MGLKNRKEEISNEIISLYKKIYEIGLVEGFDAGYDVGFEDGMKKAKKRYKAAISDGLRCGSKKCGKIMGEW